MLIDFAIIFKLSYPRALFGCTFWVAEVPKGNMKTDMIASVYSILEETCKLEILFENVVRTTICRECLLLTFVKTYIFKFKQIDCYI